MMSSTLNRNITDTSKNYISDGFETTFLKIPLDEQLKHCDSDELVPLFKRYLPGSQPILEAGSGSGRWVAWFMKNGWHSVGLDWSEALCVRARKAIPGSRFESGDMSATPFKDGEFGSIVALGSIEHSSEGPEPALKEFYRILRPNGIAIITVPYGGVMLREISRLLYTSTLWMRASPTIRRIFVKQGWSGRSLMDAQGETIREWYPRFGCNEKGWFFCEYNFTMKQMRQFLKSNGFSIIEEFVGVGDKGIVFNFGRVAGYFDDNKLRVHLTPIGKLIRRMIPARYMGHMLCYVVRRG